MSNFFIRHNIKAMSFKPNIWIGILTMFIGGVFLRPALIQIFSFLLQLTVQNSKWKDIISALGLLTLPQVMLGMAIVIMSIGLFLRARLAWTFTIILLISICLFSFLLSGNSYHVGLLSVLDCLFLMLFWRDFYQSSLTTSTLFAIISFTSLLLYALCGSLYLGDQFNPVISKLSDALYFSTVSMSTVGYGDIVPFTSTSRLFTVSIIILGITVFATSISAIIGPVLGGNLKRIIKGRISNAMRKNHIIIIGATPLALSVHEGLRKKNETVTIIATNNMTHNYPKDADVIIGEPSDNETLACAGSEKARFIIILQDDDSENAFVVLAAKEVIGVNTKIIVLVNSETNINKIKRAQPDLIFSLQTIAKEMLLHKLNGEAINNINYMELFFQN